MLYESISLPFHIPKMYGGLAEGRGLLKSGQECLILELEVKDSMFKVLKLYSNEIRIPLGEIVAIDFRKGWFTARITLRVNSLKTLQEVPGNNAGEVMLKIARRDIPQAREFVSHVSMALTTRDLKKMVEDTDRREEGLH